MSGSSILEAVVIRFEKDKQTGEYHRVGQLDLSLEGLKTEEWEIEQ